MKKLIVAAAALVGGALAAPAPAAAHVSIAIGLPGFAVVAAEPPPPPVFYGPTYYYYPGYYPPAPAVVFTRQHRGGCHGRHRGWRHVREFDD